MASTSRIDEIQTLRMFVFQDRDEESNKYYGRPMLTVEREKLMGFPVGYVEIPGKALSVTLAVRCVAVTHDLASLLQVNKLFTTLVEDALNRTMQSDQRWQDSLAQKYHHFAGNYHNLLCKNSYRFGVTTEFPYVFLRMAPPAESTKPSFYNAEGYAKQLIGQVSVPTEFDVSSVPFCTSR